MSTVHTPTTERGGTLNILYSIPLAMSSFCFLLPASFIVFYELCGRGGRGKERAFIFSHFNTRGHFTHSPAPLFTWPTLGGKKEKEKKSLKVNTNTQCVRQVLSPFRLQMSLAVRI